MSNKYFVINIVDFDEWKIEIHYDGFYPQVTTFRFDKENLEKMVDLLNDLGFEDLSEE